MSAVAHDLAGGLAAAAARRDVSTFSPILLDAAASDTPAALADLVADPRVVVVDELAAQLEQIVRGRAPAGDPVRIEAAVERLLEGRTPAAFGTWAFYPWSCRLVHVLPEPLHRELRLDRNRYAITAEEQARLGRLCIAVAGLSVGRAIVSAMAHEGIGGELRLADFDVLELSNLNRVAGGLADVGVGKVVLAARAIAELDPYIRVVAFPRGVEETTIGDFIAGADVVVDECDDLAIKVQLREHARAAGLPVVMATSHRGMLDVERFDLEPGRAVFHGLLGRRHLRGAARPHRQAEGAPRDPHPRPGQPQRPRRGLADRGQGDGLDLATARVRRGARRRDGGQRRAADRTRRAQRVRTLPRRPRRTDRGRAPGAPGGVARIARVVGPGDAAADAAGDAPRRDQIRFVVACATSAPSGGNMQPWLFEAEGNVLRARIDPARSSFLDFRNRAALLALGAALEAAKIGAHGLGLEPVARTPSHGAVWELALEPSTRNRDEHAVDALWQRCCNRRTGTSAPIAEAELATLARSAAPLAASVVTGDALPELGTALGALDRVRFLSHRLRHELISELRFSADEARTSRDGIDLASLELDGSDRAAMDVLRSGAGLDLLAALDRGWGLRNPARDAFAGSAGAIVLRAAATDRDALVEAGGGLMRLWLEATRRRLAVHPWGSPFLFHRLLDEPTSLGDWERQALTHAAAAFERVAGARPGHPILLILRLSHSAPPSARSLRRAVDDVLAFTD